MIHHANNISMQDADSNVYDEEGEVMLFPDEQSEQINNSQQMQLRGKRKYTTNNNSVMTNFNPLTALDTYENNNSESNQIMSNAMNTNNPNSNVHSHIPTQRQMNQ